MSSRGRRRARSRGGRRREETSLGQGPGDIQHTAYGIWWGREVGRKDTLGPRVLASIRENGSESGEMEKFQVQGAGGWSPKDTMSTASARASPGPKAHGHRWPGTAPGLAVEVGPCKNSGTFFP